MSTQIEPSSELKDLTHKLYEAVSNGDASFFVRHLSRHPGTVVIGTEPDEWWDDPEGALAAIRHQMQVAGDAIEIVAGDVLAYRRGDVGWVADRPTFRLAGTSVRCRHSSVFVRSDGEWHIVQHHFSIGVTNESVFGDKAAGLG